MAEPSGRVDPRREPEPDRAGVDDRGIDVRRAHQRLQTGLLRSRERAEAGARKRAVLVEERHDVGDRGERDEVEVLVDVCPERAEQLVGDAGTAELREGIARRARRDDRAVRKRLAGTVVVGHDHVEAERLRARDLLDRSDPAVDGQDERAALLGEPLDRLTGERRSPRRNGSGDASRRSLRVHGATSPRALSRRSRRRRSRRGRRSARPPRSLL